MKTKGMNILEAIEACKQGHLVRSETYTPYNEPGNVSNIINIGVEGVTATDWEIAKVKPMKLWICANTYMLSNGSRARKGELRLSRERPPPYYLGVWEEVSKEDLKELLKDVL
jgi:hypothetical protein